MKIIAVMETEGDNIAPAIAEGVKYWENSGNDTENVSIVSGKDLELQNLKPDLIVVSEKAVNQVIKNKSNLQSKCLLISGSASLKIKDKLKTDCAVSYGMSSKDTITLSSVEKDNMVLAVRRELLTLGGAIIERQEIPLKPDLAKKNETAMAAAGALLILGMPPQNLS